MPALVLSRPAYPTSPDALARLAQFVRRTAQEGVPTIEAVRYALARYAETGELPRYDAEFPRAS